MQTTRVSSLELPSLQPYRTLRRPVDHQKQGIFVAEGEKVVRRLLESDLEILSILLTEEWLAALRGNLEQRASQPELFVAPKNLVETIVGFPLHQGIMAVARIPKLIPLDEVLRHSTQPYFLAAVDGLTNAENLGVLVRNCAAFGVQAILVGETSSSPYLRRAVRNSMGAIFKLPVVQLENLAATLRAFNGQGITTIAAHPASSDDLLALGEVNSCCLVFGSEGEGISESVLAACAKKVAIMMSNGVDSLNVASASAVFLHAIRSARTNL
ncbi:MAG TPA: RNA methyltransferase [Bacteroidota bacterium]|nr:RNA methyltransferase [Bacteroidota bacterium]